jgi:integrase
MREQKGYLFKKGKSWFVRFMDDVPQPDGFLKRKLVCKKLDLPLGAKRKDAEQVAREQFLDPINRGVVKPASNMLVTGFIERSFFPEYVNLQCRASTQKQYRDIWSDLKPHLEHLGKTLREFRCVDGERLLAGIARQNPKLNRNSLRHLKSFLSGVFKQAKRLGILDGVNPMQDVSVPKAPEPEETHASTLDEIKAMLAVLPEPARTVVLTAALTGFRKGEIRGLRWADFDGKQLFVRRSFWGKFESEPKTRKSRAPVPVVKQLADALEAHRLRAGILAQDDLPIFQGDKGAPLNLNNLVARVIRPAIKDHADWHGWHSFRRGLATNLHELGVADKEIQAILRHSNIGITMNVYVKSVTRAQVDAMDTLSEEFSKTDDGTCNGLQQQDRKLLN